MTSPGPSHAADEHTVSNPPCIAPPGENSNLPHSQTPAVSEMASGSQPGPRIQALLTRDSTTANFDAQSNAGVADAGTAATTSLDNFTGPAVTQTRAAGEGTTNTLAGVMRGACAAPDVVVLDDRHSDDARGERELNFKEDLWLSTADGRFSSPVVPIVVGTAPHQQTYYLHKDVITRAKWFRTALCSDFAEAKSQTITLPEEDPAIFHFVVAYLYEGTYTPIRPIADVLVPDPDGNKARSLLNDTQDSDSDSVLSASDSSARSRQRIERRRRRRDRRIEHLRQKHPGQHRPDCACRQCQSRDGPPCWCCNAPRVAPSPPVIPLMPGVDRPARRLPGENRAHRHRRHGVPAAPPPGAMPPNYMAPRPVAHPIPLEHADSNLSFSTTTTASADPSDPTSRNDRIKTGEDMRTWLMTYQLNLRVYICADKYLLDGMKDVVARHTIDMLESAGFDAAVFPVLESCKLLNDGLRESDTLLRMVFARIGFMLPEFRRRVPRETAEFLKNNSDVNYLITCETVARREEEMGIRSTLPPLERGWQPPQGSANFGDPYFRPPPHPPVYHARVFY